MSSPNSVLVPGALCAAGMWRPEGFPELVYPNGSANHHCERGEEIWEG